MNIFKVVWCYALTSCFVPGFEENISLKNVNLFSLYFFFIFKWLRINAYEPLGVPDIHRAILRIFNTSALIAPIV